MKRVIVIGAGAAGLMAAVSASKLGAKVLLIEKMNMVGKKMGITGKGRCNVTNIGTVSELIANTPGNGKFLYSVYDQFNNKDLLAIFNSWGLETKVERGGRVFPVSDSALEVRDIFRKKLKENHAVLHLNERVTEILMHHEKVSGVVTEKDIYPADAVILCTGGKSYPLTGSTGDGYSLATRIGHTVTALRPSLVPLEIEESWAKDLMGLSLKNVEVSLLKGEKVLDLKFGEMLFTHYGVSGPIILSLSHAVTKEINKKNPQPLKLKINLKPALSEEDLDQRLQKDFSLYSKKHLLNGMKDLLPQRVIPVIIYQAGLHEDIFINQLTKEQRKSLLYTLQNLCVTITATRPIEEAIVTAGGLSVKEFNPKTMESKLVRGFYAAGEVLDVDAYTGGYNLQAAFSMGYIAGKYAAMEEMV